MPEVTAQRNYPTTKRSVARARTDCRDFLASCGLPEAHDFVDDMVLMVSELMTNAVTHGRVPGTSGRQVRMAIEKTGDVIRVEVRDTRSDTRPHLCEGNGNGQDIGGRGLVLVDALSDSWGVSPELMGKTVWVEKRLER
ncbi:ATP-binding protein [Streptomyces sp. KM273126]|uniref:ATP-binding protein n=1 Tax=Streptomyces sp. KM273126 TaxID=2545247 RepID=UPI00103A1FD7|nr:ATP-binding protein [Streptomyces sp. KM273126]MBA2807078.1 ATP-binding protein [Streptomyces sp. KM273126]